MSSGAWKRVGLTGFVVLAVGAGALGLTAGQRAGDGSVTAGVSQAASLDRPVGDELVEFRHEPAGFAISYPKGWTRSQSPDPQIMFVASERNPAENRGGSILVRVAPLEMAVGREQLAEVRKSTDAIVTSGEGVELKAEPTDIEVAGLPGLYYFYTFHDPVSGQRGAHSHYFLFHGKAMVSLVFQALPQDDLTRLAPLLDRVAESFRVL